LGRNPPQRGHVLQPRRRGRRDRRWRSNPERRHQDRSSQGWTPRTNHQNTLLNNRTSQPGDRLSLIRPLPKYLIRIWPTAVDGTTLPGPTSLGRTTPVSTTICLSPLMSTSRMPSSTRSPLGSTSETRAVITADSSPLRVVAPPPLKSVDAFHFARDVGSNQS